MGVLFDSFSKGFFRIINRPNLTIVFLIHSIRRGRSKPLSHGHQTQGSTLYKGRPDHERLHEIGIYLLRVYQKKISYAKEGTWYFIVQFVSRSYFFFLLSKL